MFYFTQTHQAGWEGFHKTSKMLKVIQAQSFHEELVQNQFQSVTSPMLVSLPRLETCGAQVLLPLIQDAAIPTPELASRDLRCRTDTF